MTDKQPHSSVFFTKKRIVGLLVFTNLVLILFLLNIQRNISTAKKQRLKELAKTDSTKYFENPLFIEQMDLFNLYKNGNRTIVMMGSSFTQQAHWNELLNRDDIANRGIGSDVSEGYLHRLQSITGLHPKICFLEIGANDLIKNIPLEIVMTHLGRIIDTLHKSIPKIVLCKCFLAANTFPNYAQYNSRVDSLNSMFDTLFSQNASLVMSDINAEISENGQRKIDFVAKDGIHLNGKAYTIWKREIEKILVQEKLLGK